MSLRAYFAAKAMQAVISSTPYIDGVQTVDAELVATNSVLLADALIAELSKP